MALLRKQLSSCGIKSSSTTNIQYPKHSSLPPNTITEFVWKDYSPEIFRNIQELGHIRYEDYMLSVCNHETLTALTYRGCSGKPFFTSHDDRFVIKILKKSEARVLIGMLPDYYSHIQKHETSLLTKYYGLHASRPGTGGTKIYFVVMENLLRSDMQMHKLYDLKGSLRGRNTSNNGSQRNSSSTLTDIAFDNCFYLEHSTRKQILEQIMADCKFLEDQGIMDYSLLLGIHIRRPESSTRQSAAQDDSMQAHNIANGTEHSRDEIIESFHRRDPTFSHLAEDTSRLRITRFGANIQARSIKTLQQSDYKEIPSQTMKSKSQESREVYLFMGIIDYLQNYNVIKRIEHAYKSLQYDSKTISSVNPKLYASRFQDFMRNIFLVEEMANSPRTSI